MLPEFFRLFWKRRPSPVQARAGSRPDSVADESVVGTDEAGAGARALYERAHALLRQGLPADAEPLYRASLQAGPNSAFTMFELGVACYQQQRLDEAFRYCSRALKLETRPEWVNSVKNIANDLGKPGGVEIWQERAEQEADVAAWLGLGNAMREAGNLESAESAYRRALALEPDSPFVMRRLGSLLAALERFEEADACFTASARGGLSPDGLTRLSAAFTKNLDAGRKDLLDGIPKMQGEMGQIDVPLVVFASCDSVYLRKFAHPLVNSIRRNGGMDCLIHLHVVNPDAEVEQTISGLRAKDPRLVMTWEQTALPNAEAAKTHYACARLLHLPQVLEHYKRPVLILDMDVLVLGSLRRVADAVGDADLGVIRWHPTRWDPWDTLSASAIWIRPTNGMHAAAEFLASYVRHFLRRKRADWFLDQIALYALTAVHTGGEAGFKKCFLPAEMALLYGAHAVGAPIPENVVFWSVTHSVEANRTALTQPPFTDYVEA